MNPDVIDNSEVKLLANKEKFDVDKKSKEAAMEFSNFDEEPAAMWVGFRLSSIESESLLDMMDVSTADDVCDVWCDSFSSSIPLITIN